MIPTDNLHQNCTCELNVTESFAFRYIFDIHDLHFVQKGWIMGKDLSNWSLKSVSQSDGDIQASIWKVINYYIWLNVIYKIELFFDVFTLCIKKSHNCEYKNRQCWKKISYKSNDKINKPCYQKTVFSNYFYPWPLTIKNIMNFNHWPCYNIKKFTFSWLNGNCPRLRLTRDIPGNFFQPVPIWQKW